jgi:cytochrome c-type biogenesis protein CcmH/NrfG
MRDHPKLIEASRNGVTSYPNEWTNHYLLGIGYEATGQRSEAITEYQKAVHLSEGNLDAAASLAHAYAEAGRNAEAEKILAGLLQRSKNTYVSPYLIATIYAGFHDNDRAFAFLERLTKKKRWTSAGISKRTCASTACAPTCASRVSFAGSSRTLSV